MAHDKGNHHNHSLNSEQASAEQVPSSQSSAGCAHSQHQANNAPPPNKQIVRVMQWNVLSLKGGTYQAIREHQPHIMFLQETRAVMKATPAYNYVSRCRDNPSRGGGVAIGIDRILTFRNLSHVVPPQLYDALELVFVQVVHEQFELYALNVYLNSYNRKRKLLEPLQ